MKKLLVTISLAFICLQFTNAQSTKEKISYVSPQKDTLLLPDNDLGKLIASTWVDTPTTPKPIILFSDEDTIKRKNDVLFDVRKKNKLIKK